jgi:glucuronosyltransferase
MVEEPFFIFSHINRTSALVNGLAEKGHNVTVLTTNTDPKPPKNVHYINLEKVADYMYNDAETDLIAMAYFTQIDAVDMVYTYAIGTCQGIQKSTNGLQTLMNYPKDFKFDLVLYDFTLGPCLIGFVHKFNYPPIVGFTAFNNPPYTASIVGGHNYYSYKPHLTTKYSKHMSFYERGVNLFLHALDY